MTNRTFFRSFAFAVLATGCVGMRAYADTVVYQDTTTNVSGFVFNGASQTGSELAANVDINQLTLASGSAGMAISSLSFQAYNFNSTAVVARATMYIWAANGTGGLPGTLLATFFLPQGTLAGSSAQTLSYTVATNSLIIPAGGVIWAGLGYDNNNGASAITSSQLNNLGGLTFDPATIGIDGTQAYFVPPGGAGSDPSVTAFGGANGADYGWTVTTAVPMSTGMTTTPEPSSLMLLGTGALGLIGAARRRLR